jgi:hypothetical protein
VYRHGVKLDAGRSAKKGLMDVLTHINPSVDGLAVLPLILPVMFIMQQKDACTILSFSLWRSL